MNLNDAKQWFFKADADFDAAKILNSAYRKHTEIICYLCAQATEKYLKGYLVFKNHKIENTHNLPYLNNLCTAYDNHFEEIKIECGVLNKFNNNIRYPDGIETDEYDVKLSLEIVGKVLILSPLNELREQIIKDQDTE